MPLFLQPQDTRSVQQPHGCTTSQSQLRCEGTEQHVKPLSGYGASTVEALAQHSTTVEGESPSTRPEQEPSLSSQPAADKQEEAAPQAITDQPQGPPDEPHKSLTQQQQRQTAPVKLPLPNAEPLHTAALAEAKVHPNCCACCPPDTTFLRV